MKSRTSSRLLIVLLALGVVFAVAGCSSSSTSSASSTSTSTQTSTATASASTASTASASTVTMTPGAEALVTDAKFPEGPRFVNGKLYYGEYSGNDVAVWDGTQSKVIWSKDGSGADAVMQIDDGSLLVVCYDGDTIERITTDGQPIASYDKDSDGNPFLGPNDITKDSQGGAYFTASGVWESDPIDGAIYYFAADGTITKVADDLHYANGIVLSNDGKTLYCAESEAGRVIQFDVAADHSLSNRKRFANLYDLDPVSGVHAYPDGLKMDSKGNLYICQYSMGRILVVDPATKTLERTIDVPSPAAPNLALSADEAYVYITAIDGVDGAYNGTIYKVPNK